MTASQPIMRGTVTFLFSDIEGSTRLEQRVGTARYGELRERHRAILREAFGAHEGIEQGTEGDSFFVVFASAREAVAAAVAAQRRLAAEPWPDGETVRVRIGIHSGEAELAGESLVGLDINRAARIAAVGHGGQILLSDATRGLIQGQLPAELRLRDLGAFRLKDLLGPEHVVQVEADDLPADFPPLRTPDARPNNLPTQLTTFVGRDAELEEAARLLSTTRLLTLTGPGGTGKTRLSLQLASGVADDFPDGVFFVPLEPIRDPMLVASRIATAVGVAETGARPIAETLSTWLRDRRLLLVLDNFEQVAAAAPLVSDLLRAAPALTVIVTSRAALRVSGEQEYPVPGLPTPPDLSHLSGLDRMQLPGESRALDLAALSQYAAVRLFIERAVAVRPGFSVTNANARRVAAISARLHGMPLAIELAAARIKLLSPDAILARLEHQLDVLAAGARDLPARQQTLRGAIAWSYDLLDEDARRLLDRLSVFAGGCDLEAAEAVCGPASELGGELVDGLMALADQSLLKVEEAADGEPRFPLLDTIREYAAERLAERGETGAIQDRHRDWFLALAERAATEMSGAGPAPLARSPGARARRHPGGPRSCDRSTGPGDGAPPRLRDVALLAEARPPRRGAPAARGDGRRALVARRPATPGEADGGARRHLLVAGGHRRDDRPLPGGARALAGDRRRGGDRERLLQRLVHVCGARILGRARVRSRGHRSRLHRGGPAALPPAWRPAR